MVQVSWNDARAYCSWAGKGLPPEAEWEYSARGGLDGQRYAWTDELTPGGRWMCNIWQGTFPTSNNREDGYLTTAPVKSFAPNGYGLWGAAGNVWEWCADWFDPGYCGVAALHSPQGSALGLSRVMRGGSYQVPQLVLQPVPRRRPVQQHARLRLGEARVSVRQLSR